MTGKRKGHSREKRLLFGRMHLMPCHWCGVWLTFRKATVDHVVELSLGGADDLSNMVVACRDCNNGRSQTAHVVSERHQAQSELQKAFRDGDEKRIRRAMKRVSRSKKKKALLKARGEWGAGMPPIGEPHGPCTEQSAGRGRQTEEADSVGGQDVGRPEGGGEVPPPGDRE